MAATPSTRNRRDPVARFTSSPVSESEIKAQLQCAQKIQSAQRARHAYSFWHPKPTRRTPTMEDTDIRLSASVGKDELQDRPDSVSTIRDESVVLDRTLSFDSVSIAQRMEEAARQRQYRDSPVSACHTDRVPLDPSPEVDDPCPPLRSYTVKEVRQNEKGHRKSLRKQKSQQRLAEQSGGHHNNGPMSGRHDLTAPRRSISDPAMRRPRDFAAQLIKKMKGSKSAKLTRPRSSPAAAPPHVDDFESKADLQRYLQGALPETVVVNQPPAAIAELPGSIPLPAYTPYRGSPAASTEQDTAKVSPTPVNGLQRATSSPPMPCCDPAPKMMRCDNCQFGIKHEDVYLQCLICNHGDRILCDACDSSGYSCRHQLIRKRRNYLQEVDGLYRSNSDRSPSPSRPQRNNTLLVDRTKIPHPHEVKYNSDTSAPITVQREGETPFRAQVLELQQREEQLARRERESELREREGMLRIREAELASRERTGEAKQNADFMRSCMEMAISLGAQFANISRSSSNASTTPSTTPPPLSTNGDHLDPYFPGSRSDTLDSSSAAFRAHGASKRKAGAGSRVNPSRSISGRQSTSKDSTEGQDAQDEEADDGRAPKRPRRGSESLPAEGKSSLYACHYCKFDSARYSDCNNTEKHYRGCSSGFWTDISRLKQHLYRVHYRKYHRCHKCWVSFKSDEEVTIHQRSTECIPGECPFPEKFDQDVYNELHKKRPKTSPEEVWFLVWDSLFPGTPRPSSPYTDQTTSGQPGLTDQQNQQTLAELLGARLGQQLPDEVRSFVLDQLWASMADLATQQSSRDATISAVATPASAADRSRMAANPPRLSIPTQMSPSENTSSQPVSAISSASTSDSRWHNLSAHRFSFSRPLTHKVTPPQAPLHSHHESTDSAIDSAIDTRSSSEHFFNVPTAYDPNDHGWGEGADSWEEGDEAGLALTTDFDFQLPSVEQPVSDRNPSPAPLAPVNLRSLEDPGDRLESNGIPILTSIQPKQLSEASVDSGYGSTNSARLARRPTAPTAKGSWPATQVEQQNTDALPDAQNNLVHQSETSQTVADGDIDWHALNVPWQDFIEPKGWDGNEQFQV
ncbi:uncharacterized protein AB675_6575 [Cyphellophora attinorum]|uniref:C2H2-type domain-containing protein n=1 Tax=Cyphellophora attinorum TaxID=1664694 RepID=A0A0N1HVZ2_9EURO|nr:uncharacterized protein AB675_6575 [Phialophora attinorum]KPI44172.1 hypothetical protein AB675_6575 [Phialophora attinorum]